MNENKNNKQSQGGGGNWLAILFILLIVLIIISIRDQKQLAQEDKDNALSANKKIPQTELAIKNFKSESVEISWNQRLVNFYCWTTTLVETMPLHISNIDELLSMRELLSKQIASVASHPDQHITWGSKYFVFEEWNLDIKNNLYHQTTELLENAPQCKSNVDDLRSIYNLARKFVDRMDS